MLKKLVFLFAFIPLLLLPVAQAENAATYAPGSATRALFSQAYEQGDMVLMDMYFSLKTNENAAAVFGEEAAVLSALGEALENTVFTVGLGKVENGVRALVAAGYLSGEEQVGLDLLAELTRDGVAIMSGAIPNERFTAKWETLLALTGAGEAEIAQILSLRDVDWNSAFAQLAAQSAALLEAFTQIAAPYGETIMAHIAALPTDVRTDVAEEAGFPAAATEVCFVVTQKALGDLAVALADQLEQDTTLCTILDAAFAESSEPLTAAQLCQSVREAAAGMTDESMPVYIYIGLDENGSFIYLNIVRENEAGEAALLNIVIAPYADAEGISLLTADLLTLAADDSVLDGVSLALFFSEAESETTVMHLYVDMFANGANLCGVELAQNAGPMETENGLRGFGGQYAMAFSGMDGESALSAIISADVAQSETVEGGEESAVVGSVEIALDDLQIPMTFEAYALTELGEDGPTASISSFYNAPALGVDEYMEGYTLYTAEYALDMSTVSHLTLETASQEELQALGQRAMTALKDTLTTLFDLLPEALMESVSQQEEARLSAQP